MMTLKTIFSIIFNYKVVNYEKSKQYREINFICVNVYFNMRYYIISYHM